MSTETTNPELLLLNRARDLRMDRSWMEETREMEALRLNTTEQELFLRDHGRGRFWMVNSDEP